jgi:hypothetical protein
MRRIGALGALTGRTPAKLFVESSASSVLGEYSQPSALDATTPHPIEHRVMRFLGDSSTPALDGGSEVQELVASDRSETDDCAVDYDHIAVDPRRHDLL